MSLQLNPKKNVSRHSPKEISRLTIVGPAELVERQFSTLTDGIEYMLQIQWDPIPPRLNNGFKMHITKCREVVPPLVSRYQMYTVFPNSMTLVDKSIKELSQKGEIKRIVLDEMDESKDLIIRTSDYLSFMDNQSSTQSKAIAVSSLSKFKEFILANRNLSLVDKKKLMEGGFTLESLQELINMGYFSIIPGKADSLRVSVPRYGFHLKLVLASTKYVLKLLNSNKWKELRECDIQEKWNRYKLRFKEFKGLRLNYVLCHLIGSGKIEVLLTAEGRALKVL